MNLLPRIEHHYKTWIKVSLDPSTDNLCQLAFLEGYKKGMRDSWKRQYRRSRMARNGQTKNFELKNT
jgi:hypothetical protein